MKLIFARHFMICFVLCSIGLLRWSDVTLAQNMATLVDEIEPKVVELRGLPFLNEVEKAFQSPAELQQVLLKELERTYPGETLPSLEKRLLKFGFVASPIDLHQMITQLLSQQIAGYYDPREKKMVLIEPVMSSSGQGAMFPIEYFTRFIVENMGLSLEKILLSHELTHVLQDQHFQLLSLPFEDLDPEDVTSAVRALIEGDATLVMLDYILEQQGTDSTQVPDLANALRTWADSPFVRGFGLFQTIPRYIVDNLLFSYTYGYDFVLQLKRHGGWELVNQAYRDFPVSTEQILHPEKYFSNRDLPTKIELPALPESFSAWRELEHNTLGEFNISILIDGYLPADQARLASAGWDGDRFSLYENRDTGQLLLVWDTTWDTEQDAREFFQVYKDVLGKRYKDTALPGDTLSEEVLYEHKLWKTDNGEIYIEIHGTDVLILDGVPEHLLNETISLFR
jgi:hypothetical protein